MTITEFLLARIAEDEDRAKRAGFGYGSVWQVEVDSAEDWATVHADGRRDMVGCEDGDVSDHIARHDPARVLAECESKRRIVVRLQMSRMLPVQIGDHAAEAILRALALPHADHPDYDEAWRP